MSLDILKYIYYKDGWLYWNRTIHNKCKQDNKAGTIKQNGYVEIQYKHKRYYAHRLIWELLKFPIPDGAVINHIDGNPTNNLLTNLECVSQVINLHSIRKLTNNTTGFRGISIDKRNGKYSAEITIKGTRYRLTTTDLKEAQDFLYEKRKTLLESSSVEGGKGTWQS